MIEYAKKELARIEHDEDGLQDLMDKCVLEVLGVFAEQGHSGFSAGYVIRLLERLMRFLPLTPLTGEDDEWNEIAPGKYQNRRCGRIFKENGQAYDIDGKAFSDDGGRTWFTNRNSRVPVSFPYEVPTKPEFVYLDRKKGESDGK